MYNIIAIAFLFISSHVMAAATPPVMISPSVTSPAAEDSPDTDSLDNTNSQDHDWSDPDDVGFWGSNDGTGGGEDDFQAFTEDGE